MTEPVLELDDLHTTIEVRDGVVHAVDGVSLRVGRGELLGLVGESGCGKTMTALSILRLLPEGGRIASGRILLGGEDIARLPEPELRRIRGGRIGMVFQDPLSSLNPTLPIGRQVGEPLELHTDLSPAARRERVLEVLGLVGLPRAAERSNDYPHQLSGGMRQRVMIARALVCEPDLLIADEPTTALDVTIQHQILELIDELRARVGMAVILVTHDLGVVAGRADRVAVMYAGRIAELTDTRQLFGNPRHPYTEALFEALPENSADTGDRLYSIPGLPPELLDPPRACRFAPRCRHATDRCRAEEPPLRGEIAGHDYACFHPVGDSELTEPTGRIDVREPGRAPAVLDAPAAAVAPPLLTVRNLVKDFPVTSGAILRRRVGAISAIADVSFSVAAGETFGLVGESGCGKSTIGRCVVGLETPTGGSIAIEGDTHLVFQDTYSSLDPRMRAGTVIAEPLVIHGVGTRAQRAARVRELLGEVGLPAAAAERYPHEFSGGQRQRLALARALALEPKLIVADEPVSALDVSIQAQILNLMSDLRRRHGLTYLFISHDLSVVRYLSTRIGVMYLGKLVESGPAAEVYRTPRHPYTHGLIGAVPIADPWAARERLGVIAGELPSARNPPSGCRFRTRCPLAQEICAHEEPPMRPFGANGHQAACHFPLAGEPAQDVPHREEVRG
ncbi:dipeptide ABC transporter ATP-binding protein [Nocardia pseudobrasiliensis]|uniref:Peptide/nickel transport system ATP-binding protein n=1 Tax=Nocardia pseudobrasiliensis TaxID=45979 RepID=A0A370I9K2_9NOCA|nr:ABC transporter ATP-binding protein [Nocardia pseudobrasiliensis]RDI67405.1 peptide/nickel transport system ATP-binding protein [Nocardia pseudobrasiliensis]